MTNNRISETKDGPEGSTVEGDRTGPSSSLAKTNGAPWARPIVLGDQAWTRFEIWLAVVVFVLEAFSMALWVCLKGFSMSPAHVSAVVFRALIGAAVLGIAAHAITVKRAPHTRRAVTLAACAVGIVASKAWVNVGADYASNLLNWYQQASFLTLLGGLRGVGTRLTMLLALIGGSLATARGRHIVIDVVTRFVGHRVRTAMVLAGWFASAFVCAVAAWGFFDHIAIESFGADADDGPGAKIHRVARRLEEDFFIARKQVALDFKSIPHVVLRGETYSDWLTGKEWNAWVESAGFSERFGAEATRKLKIPDDETRAPLVVVPGRGEPRGELINAAYLVFPIGLLVIAARFVVRALLTIGGHASVDSDESEDFGEHGRSSEGESAGDRAAGGARAAAVESEG